MSRYFKKYSEKGLSLVEILLVIVILGLTVFLIANLPNAVGLIGKSRNINLAREIAAGQIEGKRTIQYLNLADGVENIIDTRLNLLSEGSGTIEVKPCDPIICTNSEEVKEVIAQVFWKEKGQVESVKLTTFISEGGLTQ